MRGCPLCWSRKERAAAGRRVIRLGAPWPLNPGSGGRVAPGYARMRDESPLPDAAVTF